VPAVPVVADQKDPLEAATYENTPEFTFNGLRSAVKVLRVVDGDTVDIALAQPDTAKIYRHRVRLYGIDTPEKRPSKSDPLRHLEIEASYRAKEALEQRLRENDYLVLAVFSHADKYGRLLCTLYDKTGEDLNQWMITRGFATEYFGKTKKKFQAIQAQSQPDSNHL
jgi:endonuclease YncB( thermonuclease family)